MKRKTKSISPVHFQKPKPLPKSQPKLKLKSLCKNKSLPKRPQKSIPLQEQINLLYNQMLSSSSNVFLNLQWISNFKNLIQHNNFFQLNKISSSNIIPKSNNNIGSSLFKNPKFWILYIEYHNSLLNLINLISLTKTAIKYMSTKEQILLLQTKFSSKIKQMKIALNEIEKYCKTNSICINENDINYEYLLSTPSKEKGSDVIHPGNMHKQVNYDNKGEIRMKMVNKENEDNDKEKVEKSVNNGSVCDINKSDLLVDQISYSQLSESEKMKYKEQFIQKIGIDNVSINKEIEHIKQPIDETQIKYNNEKDIDFVFQGSEQKILNPLLQLVSNDSKCVSSSHEFGTSFTSEPISFNMSDNENRSSKEEDSYYCHLKKDAQERGVELSDCWKLNLNSYEIKEEFISLATTGKKMRNFDKKYEIDNVILNFDYDL